ncbi:1-acyl-sn-glycerol-3-phosphate acyltransferase [Sphingomonas histidinilytica]|uniref:1-acyl-sn-glycerol-3-phosphate acyltransferase n=1 Tax=Rhizorhabdus histidinilytica TaxID=439228 RepID=A0A1T5E678_9SPHN|nr:lysophospholipid acyltransferase family protein [Rhizorhabdus histidinilytica]MBO9379317.1 1-acyl-sn-glycerol-3-phosphate acyltransferase [Rhizorhabdus histidinilytica]SKB79404.1 1-acyl-sn-glycerol-3-phosphate acyltransferase [Rhizorhabdus histidinilytica]
MTVLRSTLFAILFYAGTVVAVLTAFLIVPFGDAPLRRHALRWARFHRWCARWILGIRSSVEGVVPPGPHLYAAKHQSMFETLELLLIVGDPAAVLKRELADIPLFGQIARREGVIPVDRAGSAKALRRMMRAATAARDSGRSILIFPEGTRVAPGEQPPLQPGFAGLYKALDLPVVPVALDSGRLWPRNSFLKRPGIITIRLGDPVPAGLPRAEIEARVHAAMNVLDR